MKHWSVDTRELQKDKEAYAIWKLEQAINWGISDGKLAKKDLIEYWDKLDIDPQKKKFLALLIG